MARRRYTPKLKAQVVLEVLAGGKTPGQVAKAYGVRPNSVQLWKRRFVERAPEVFAGDTAVNEYERRIRDLEQLLGKKEVEIALLKTSWARHAVAPYPFPADTWFSGSGRPCPAKRYPRPRVPPSSSPPCAAHGTPDRSAPAPRSAPCLARTSPPGPSSPAAAVKCRFNNGLRTASTAREWGLYPQETSPTRVLRVPLSATSGGPVGSVC